MIHWLYRVAHVAAKVLAACAALIGAAAMFQPSLEHVERGALLVHVASSAVAAVLLAIVAVPAVLALVKHRRRIWRYLSRILREELGK